MLMDTAKALQPRAELGSGDAAPEQEVLGKPGFSLDVGKAVENEELRVGAVALLAREAPSTEPELSLVREALSRLVFLPSGDQTVGSKAEPETGQTKGSEAEPVPSLVRGALAVLLLLPGDGQTTGSEAEPETV
jgi:hypothetical protein